MTRDDLPIVTIDGINHMIIQNPDQVDLLRSGDHIVYKCKNCGKEIIKYYDVRHKESTKQMLCRSCKMMNCENRNAPVYISNATQLDSLKYSQKFTYNCIKCGISVTLEFRPQRKSTQYAQMLCVDCRLREMFGGSNTYLHSKAYKDKNVEIYGTENPNFQRRYKYARWNYGDTLYFASYWEFCVYLYYTEIEPWHTVIYEPFEIPYHDGTRLTHYQLDFLIDGRMVEVKGDQYLDSEGNLFFPYTTLHGKPMTEKQLSARRREWDSKNACMKLYNIEIWSKKECYPIIKAVEERFGKEWLNSFSVSPHLLSSLDYKRMMKSKTSPYITYRNYCVARNMVPICQPYLRYNYGITPFELDSMKNVSSQDIPKPFAINGKGVIPNFYTNQ